MTTLAFPLQWPAGVTRTKAHTRKTARYTVTPGVAVRELQDELRMLGATGVVVSSNAPLKVNGEPRADALTARIDDPGVAVYFTRSKQQHVLACDAWVYPWQNIRAVGLTVAGLRQIQRSGATNLLEQAFAGFKQIAGPRAWWVVLGVSQDVSADEILAAYRARARAAHPDQGGSHDAMSELNRARDEAMKARGTA